MWLLRKPWRASCGRLSLHVFCAGLRVVIPTEAADLPPSILVNQLERVYATFDVVDGVGGDPGFVSAGDVHDVSETIHATRYLAFEEAGESPHLDQLLSHASEALQIQIVDGFRRDASDPRTSGKQSSHRIPVRTAPFLERNHTVEK